MSIPLATLIWKNSTAIAKGLDRYDKKREKAAQTAVKVEGFSLMKLLKKEVFEGRPGGEKLTPLAEIAKRTKTGRLRKYANAPLAPFGRLVRYMVQWKPFNVSVGFIDQKVNSRGWKKLVLLHQSGGGSLLSGSRSQIGSRLAKIGAKLAKKGDPAAKYFFLRKGSRIGASQKARPEIDPFWAKYESQARRNIMRNWGLKMRGIRI